MTNHAATGSMAGEYISRRKLCRRLSISPSTVYRRGLQRYALAFGAAVRYHWPSIVRDHRLYEETDGAE